MEERLIVSLTSYPARIYKVAQVISTLMVQIRRADMIILWLAEDEFPQKEKELPEELLELRNYGLSIRWCDNIKPHKKYFYTMQEYPNDIVITVDDDVYYSPRLISTLYDAYQKNKHSVICLRANRITRPPDKHTYDYAKFKIAFKEVCDVPLTDVLPTGIGGVLYPPHSIPQTAFNKELIKKNCLCQDDIWLKIWSLINGYTSVIVKSKIHIDTMDEFQENCLHIDNKEGGNNNAFQAISEWLDENYYKGILYEKLFESGNSIDNYWKGISPYKQDLKTGIFKKFSEKELYVYGAGKGAELVTRILGIVGELKPKAYIVADTDKNPPVYFGVAVCGINDIKPPENPYRIIISPAERHHQKIISDLKARGWSGFIMIRDEWMGELIACENREEEAINNTLLDFAREDCLNDKS